MGTIPLFAAVVLAVHVSDTHGALTVWGAYLYFWARVVYVFLYAAGVPLIRSLAWNVATFGIFLFVAALLSSWTSMSDVQLFRSRVVHDLAR